MIGALHKLAFLGSPGAGKTTCIGAISDIAPMTTDVAPTDALLSRKATTTVAFDYGEIDLGDEGRFLLYGLPGQARFAFMMEVIRDSLIGAVVLVDALAAEAADDLRTTLDVYRNLLIEVPFVVALNKAASPPEELRQSCLLALRQSGLKAPICILDARKRADIARVVKLLFVMIELGGHAATVEPLP